MDLRWKRTWEESRKTLSKTVLNSYGTVPRGRAALASENSGPVGGRTWRKGISLQHE